MTAVTSDTFFDGRIKVKQSSSGYRFSIDAVLLSHYAMPAPGDKVLDLGTGCGIIPLILAYKNQKTTIYGVELQDELAGLASINVKNNRFEKQVKILCCDMTSLNINMISGPADLVISNPPFRKAESGRINPNIQKAIARHEIRVTLDDVIKTAGRMLRNSGRFITVYPADRLTDLIIKMRFFNIEPKLLRTVQSKSSSEAWLIIMEGIKGAGQGGLNIAPPLIIYKNDGSYTHEVEKFFIA